MLPDIAIIAQHMQDAVDVVLQSEHATSKVAACIFNPHQKQPVSYSCVNARPSGLKGFFCWDERIGGRSQFVHAEAGAIAGYEGDLKGAHICVTDPCCPNCMKALAEAGVEAIYIDHKGFAKEFITLNGHDFSSMSMFIAARAGMSVYMVNRKAELLMPITVHKDTSRPYPAALKCFEFDEAPNIETLVKRFAPKGNWAMGVVRCADGRRCAMLAQDALPVGILPQDVAVRGPEASGKYHFRLHALSRLLIGCKREGLMLDGWQVACAPVPPARALVDALGYGVQGLYIYDKTQSNEVLDALVKVGVLKVF